MFYTEKHYENPNCALHSAVFFCPCSIPDIIVLGQVFGELNSTLIQCYLVSHWGMSVVKVIKVLLQTALLFNLVFCPHSWFFCQFSLCVLSLLQYFGEYSVVWVMIKWCILSHKILIAAVISGTEFDCPLLKGVHFQPPASILPAHLMTLLAKNILSSAGCCIALESSGEAFDFIPVLHVIHIIQRVL